MKTCIRIALAFCCIAALSCDSGPGLAHTRYTAPVPVTATYDTAPSPALFDTAYRVIHVFVALCDNKYQGIVPVPARIGNGQDPASNLYWVGYGVKSYFKSSKEWKFVQSRKTVPSKTTGNKDSLILEQAVFKHATKNWYLVADAYNGRYIRECTQDFLASCAGLYKDTVQLPDRAIGTSGNARMIAYIGHDGLMDFQLDNVYQCADGKTRDCIILACYSKSYFSEYIKSANANPLLWTTHLMGPEAYTLHDALTGYLLHESSEQVRTRAASAYSKYTKCSLKAAKNLLVYGW